MAKNVDKSQRDLKIAEIVYYSIGGLVLLTGLVFSIFGLILLNPAKENIENTPLKIAETDFFNWLNIDTTFAGAGTFLLIIAVIYFVIVFSIFCKKGDEVSKKINNKKVRQRQVVFTAPTSETPVEEVSETKEQVNEEIDA